MSRSSLTNSIQDSEPHSHSTDEILTALETNREQGLSEDEAQQRLKEYGHNQLKEHKQKSLIRILIDQITNPIVYLLTAAAILAFVFGDIPEGIAIVVVLVLNTVIGFWMEFQARQSMNALQQMDKITATVIRSGETQEIDATNLVPGDIIALEAGDLIPADARILTATEFSIDESPLTGESVPVTKSTEPVDSDTSVADRSNMAFKGTAVTDGKGKAVVVATGMETEIGSISEMVSEADEEQIPLNLKLEQLTKNLIWATVGLAFAFFCLGWLMGEETYQLVQTAIAWTIAAIPEGLPIVASIALARGMLRLADHNVIVKRLASVETLGETTVIFTDKTGTLTHNRLTLNRMEFAGSSGEIQWQNNHQNINIVQTDNPDQGFDSNDERLNRFFEIATLCNDAELTENKNNNDNSDNGSGDPLDLALLQFGKAFRPDDFQKLRANNRLDEEPFDSEDMVMGTIYEIEDRTVLFCKGAPEAIMQRCTKIMHKSEEQAFTEDEIEEWEQRNEALSQDGLRVIALAFQELDKNPQGDQDVEKELMHELTFLGLAGFIDPPRDAVKESIDTCREAGIKVEMVTGDHPGTARNIAQQVNIIDKENDQSLHGSDLQKDLEDHDADEIINTRIFARTDPGQKLDLISYYKENGDIVAMTGDGVNDAPALKKADIGISMGKKGTQVAQEVSDMVLMDDSFASIVEAIREGRVIFGNIRKFIMYQLSYHLSEILIIAAISFSIFQLPLLPLQLLFLNLLSDVFPALALGIGKGNPNIMKHKPKDPSEPIISKQQWFMIGAYGTILTVYITGSYFFAFGYWDLSAAKCNNVAFFSLAFAQLLHTFNMREADESIWDNQITRNKYVWGAIAFCATVIFIAYLIPQISAILAFQALEPRIWILIAITSLLPILTIQALKAISKNYAFNI